MAIYAGNWLDPYGKPFCPNAYARRIPEGMLAAVRRRGCQRAKYTRFIYAARLLANTWHHIMTPAQRNSWYYYIPRYWMWTRRPYGDPAITTSVFVSFAFVNWLRAYNKQQPLTLEWKAATDPIENWGLLACHEHNQRIMLHFTLPEDEQSYLWKELVWYMERPGTRLWWSAYKFTRCIAVKQCRQFEPGYHFFYVNAPWHIKEGEYAAFLMRERSGSFYHQAKQGYLTVQA